MLGSKLAPKSVSDDNLKSSSRYYIALDGLRAVAVLMVFCQHYGAAKAWIFGWGWTGVDVFFVLSGFLITGILYDSQNKQHRYRDFYARRTLRIFPLYYAVWLAILLLTPVAHWQWNWRWALWPAYVGNYARFLFLHVAGDSYQFDRILFGQTVEHWFGTPMHLWIGHFWSLCVEEQFYLIWPFIVYTVRKREALIKICIGVIITMPLFRWLLTVVLPLPLLRMELFYRSLPTRLDALLIGGLIALLLRGPEQKWLSTWRHRVLAGAGAAFVMAYLISVKLLKLPFYGSATNWIGIVGFTLIDVFAAALILECIHPGSWLGQALSFKPLRLLGIVSYGFYVYHDLLHDFFALFAMRFFPRMGYAGIVVTALMGTALISTLSYNLLEKPMLKLKARFTSQVHLTPRN
ncbi:acyltransferase family protein [Acidipila rosea]|uniref:Peptidoglycan/LPS O-acetylase OafA/YrhL n=1 Tax=Acidipila rosea TaxID=768535 RepID=A0A4R1L7A9_9BACT|nr:acyltransferase [Acidipila rosea]TCK74108.1 peptidoglycan/LPS O-acetylase OafA/YrhL [Acidipila rosea]